MTFFSKLISVFLPLLLLAACNQEINENNDNGKQQQMDSLIITNAWARPAVEGTNSAAYMTIHNHTSGADTLVGVSGDAVTIAEFHESYGKEGMMGMRPADTLIINSGGRLELKPGGYHVMLMQVKQQLIPGDSLRLNLKFTEAGVRKVVCAVQ